MKIENKKNVIISTVVCVLFLLLSTPVIQPIRAATALSNSAMSVDIQQISKNVFSISVGNTSVTLELLEDGQRISTISDDGNITTYDVKTELKPIYNATLGSVSRSTGLVEKVLLINGTETVKLTMNQFVAPQTIEYQNNPSSSLTNINYWWDGVYFVEDGGQYIQWPHPDRDYYGISLFQDWGMLGNQLCHYQFSQDTSRLLAQGGPAIIGAAIGAAIGIFATPVGAVILAVVGAIVGELIAYAVNSQILDEDDCLWWWVSQAFMNWLVDNVWYLEFLYWTFGVPAVAYEVANAFWNCGYLRVGSLTFYDAIGAGNPSPPPPPPSYYYVSSIAQTGTWGAGAVNNPNGLIGSSNDGSYVQLWGGNYGDGGQIVGWMNQEAHGHIYLYGHSGSGYYTHLYTFVSYSNNYDWTQTSVQTVSGTNDRWIDCGSYSGNFRYIAIAAIDDNGMSANIFIDSVKVQP